MNAPHLHLILNHFPAGGMLLALPMLLLALWRPNPGLARVALAIVALAGLITIPTYLSGDEASEWLEKVPGISEQLIEAHEEAAEKAIWLIGAAALAAFAGLSLSWKRNAVPKKLLAGTAALTAIAFGLLAWTNQLGGEIRHSEIRSQGALDAGEPAP